MIKEKRDKTSSLPSSQQSSTASSTSSSSSSTSTSLTSTSVPVNSNNNNNNDGSEISSAGTTVCATVGGGSSGSGVSIVGSSSGGGSGNISTCLNQSNNNPDSNITSSNSSTTCIGGNSVGGGGGSGGGGGGGITPSTNSSTTTTSSSSSTTAGNGGGGVGLISKISSTQTTVLTSAASNKDNSTSQPNLNNNLTAAVNSSGGPQSNADCSGVTSASTKISIKEEPNPILDPCSISKTMESNLGLNCDESSPVDSQNGGGGIGTFTIKKENSGTMEKNDLCPVTGGLSGTTDDQIGRVNIKSESDGGVNSGGNTGGGGGGGGVLDMVSDNFGMGILTPGASGRLSGGNDPTTNLGCNVTSSQQNLQSTGLMTSKQSGGSSMEYMQQQSQIFVFSTALANKGAEAVINGQYPSIIAYHCSQAATKKFLEKHPLKIAQFNRQNQAQWLNSITMMKNKGYNIRSGPNGQPLPPSAQTVSATIDKHLMSMQHVSGPQQGQGGVGNNEHDDLVGGWGDHHTGSDPSHMSLDGIVPNGQGTGVNGPTAMNNLLSDSGGNMSNITPSGGSPLRSVSGPTQNPAIQQRSPGSTVQQVGINVPLGAASPIGNIQPSLQGVKVPDEVLTPQQLQHREESLATIRKMQQIFFPEQGLNDDCMMDDGQPGGGNVGGGPPSGGPNQKIQMQPQHQPGGGPQQQMIGGMPGTGAGVMSNQMMGSGAGGGHGGINSMRCGLGPRVGQILRPIGPGGMMSGDEMNPLMGGVGQGGGGTMIGGGMGPGGTNQIMGGMSPHGNMGGNSMMSSPMGGPPGMQQQHQMMGQMNACSSGPMNQQQKQMTGMMGPGGNSVAAQMEWTKLQHQFYESKGKMMPLEMSGFQPGGGVNPHTLQNRQIPPPMRSNSGPRSQGPPPPYHQTQRSASVPIATQSPNPSSPNNPTSNLSLPSPRAVGGGSGSTLSSPADIRQQQPFKHLTATGQSPTSQDSPLQQSSTASQRSHHNHSNPSTPLSSHMSPNASLKDFDLSGGPNQNQTSQQQTTLVKEPNLMPVPSPQQIQYLNTFDGQELTIQKQPNTGLKDSPQNSTIAGGNGGTTPSQPNVGDRNLSGSNTPLTPSGGPQQNTSNPQGGGGGGPPSFSIPSSPQTPSTVSNLTTNSTTNDNKNQRSSGMAASSVTAVPTSTATSSSGTGGSGPSPQNSNRAQNPGNDVGGGIGFPPLSPVGPNFSNSGGPVGGGGTPQGSTGGMKMGNFPDVSPNGLGGTGCGNKLGTKSDSPGQQQQQQYGRADNLPLNPNSNVVPNPKSSHFDPISSLAQMSQQLTTGGTINGQQGSGPGGGGPPGMLGGGGAGGYEGMGEMGSMLGIGPPHDVGPGPNPGMMGSMDCQMGGMGGMMGPGGVAQYGGPNPMMSGAPNPVGPLMMGGPRSLSPKLGGSMVGGSNQFGGPRMIGRSHGGGGGGPFNGANIQVKASAPNTIQYLPTRPQIGGNQQSRPPSLDFLHRFTNPMNSMDMKMNPNQNMPFYSNCNQMGGGIVGGPHHMDGPNGPGGGMNDHPMGGPMGGMGGMPPHMMNQNMMMRGMRPHNPAQMMRMSGPPPPHLLNSHFNGPPNGGGSGGGQGGPGDQMFPGGGVQPNSQMFVTGSKGSPIIGNPLNEAGQSLPSSIAQQGGQPGGGGGPNNFKSSQFVGPSTTDPNYAQQFHNFQQQLYATNTRSQLNQQGGGPNQNQSFFVPK